MRTETVMIQALGQRMPMTLPAKGEFIYFKADVDHADWKTRNAFPRRYPTIQEGMPCKVVDYMQNLYGIFVRVEHRHTIYDIPTDMIRDL